VPAIPFGGGVQFFGSLVGGRQVLPEQTRALLCLWGDAQRLAQGYGKMFERGGRGYAKDGFAEAKYFVGGTFKLLQPVTFRPRMTTS